MMYHIVGNTVEKAEVYELVEKIGQEYLVLSTAPQIDFDLSLMGFDAGDHVLLVRAKANGYSTSANSNEVTYSVT